MPRIKTVLLVAMLAVIAALVWTLLRGDQVILGNTSGAENGLLVSAQASTGVLWDQSFTSSAATIDVGKLTAAPMRNEVVAFTNSRPVAIVPTVAWTSAADAVNLQFSNEIQISVTIWIVDTPFAAQQLSAASHCATAVAMWTAERMGVAFAPGGCDIQDATTKAGVSQFRGPRARSFTCDTDQASLQTAVPPVTGRINVYVVHAVNSTSGSGTGFGTSCGTSDFVALGSGAIDGTFVHELGHNFSLIHVDGMAGFDATNFMFSVSPTRLYFTEGQLFRAHFTPAIPLDQQPGSALNSVYNARPTQPTRNCDQDPCPLLVKRIWADGAMFPPN